jgi:hypothetical protein
LHDIQTILFMLLKVQRQAFLRDLDGGLFERFNRDQTASRLLLWSPPAVAIRTTWEFLYIFCPVRGN